MFALGTNERMLVMYVVVLTILKVFINLLKPQREIYVWRQGKQMKIRFQNCWHGYCSLECVSLFVSCIEEEKRKGYR